LLNYFKAPKKMKNAQLIQQPPAQEIAQEIAAQLGGARRLKIMTGADLYSDNENRTLIIRTRVRGAKANYIRIRLTSMDLYDMEFFKGHGGSLKPIAEFSGIYNDQLKGIFERTTGLRLSL